MSAPKRPARTPAQRRADLRARAVTLLMDDDAALLRAADGVVLEALLHAFRRRLTHDFAGLSRELLRRMESARVTVTPSVEPDRVEPSLRENFCEVEPDAETFERAKVEDVTVTQSPDPAVHVGAVKRVTVTPRTYPPEIRSMAVSMADQGEPSRAICRAILDRCGKAPDTSNIAKMIRQWRAALE